MWRSLVCICYFTYVYYSYNHTIMHWFSACCLFTVPIYICKDRLKMLCACWGRLVCSLRELGFLKDLPSGSRSIVKQVLFMETYSVCLETLHACWGSPGHVCRGLVCTYLPCGWWLCNIFVPRGQCTFYFMRYRDLHAFQSAQRCYLTSYWLTWHHCQLKTNCSPFAQPRSATSQHS